MLLGLLLAYGPISSTASLDQNLLVTYGTLHPVNRFPTILPLLIPVAIWLIPYTDMLLAVIRRTMKGKSPFDADRQHLHHRLLNMGHSHRQSVLLMYLWAALFSGLVVGLSVVRIQLIWFALITLAAIGALVLATAPKLRPWRHRRRQAGAARGSRVRSADRTPSPRTLPHRSAGRYPALPPRSFRRQPAAGNRPAANGRPRQRRGSRGTAAGDPRQAAASRPWAPVPSAGPGCPGSERAYLAAPPLCRSAGDLRLFCCSLRERRLGRMPGSGFWGEHGNCPSLGRGPSRPRR